VGWWLGLAEGGDGLGPYRPENGSTPTVGTVGVVLALPVRRRRDRFATGP
jgi:hypothetical protein